MSNVICYEQNEETKQLYLPVWQNYVCCQEHEALIIAL